MQEVYRRAASILVLRPTEVCTPGPSTTLRARSACTTVYSILLLHKPRKKDDWQLPQGGIEEGEGVTGAALRELQEEAGLTGCRVLGTSKQVYQYDFPESFRKFRPDNVKGQRIAYVFAQAPADAAVRVDGTEVDGSAWVEVEQLGQYIKRREYLEIVEELFHEASKGIRS